MKNKLKQLIALILAMSMCLSLLSTNVWAAEASTEYTLDVEDSSEETESVLLEEAEDQAAEEDSEDEVSSAPKAPDSGKDTAAKQDTKVEAQELLDSGTCGSNLTWTLERDGTLTISGDGAMDDYVISGEIDPWYQNRTRIKSVFIDYGVTSIGASAFMNCSNMLSAVISSSVTSIGAYAFSGCTSLSSLTYPTSLTSIGENAFYGCTSLSSIPTVAGGNDSGDSGGSSSTGDSSGSNPTAPGDKITLGETYTSGDYQYIYLGDNQVNIIKYTGSDANLSIPSVLDGYAVIGIENAGNYYGTGAFFNKTFLHSVTIPSSITRIGMYSFDRCFNLKTVVFSDNSQLTCIGDYAFCNCDALERIAIPDGVTEIGYGAFSSCEAMMDVTLNSALQTIGPRAFAGNVSLNRITIPDSVTTIGDHALGYDYNAYSDTVGSKISGFSIMGTKGTAAESYAKDCGFSFTGTKPTPATLLTLTATLVADTTSSLGHAFLVIRNDTLFDVYIGDYVLPAGEQATLGLRGGEPWLEGFGGAYINVEAFIASAYHDFSYVTCVIDQEKLTKIANHYQKKSRYELDLTMMVHNCTTAATEAWDLVCPPEDYVTPINLPALLQKQMESSNMVKKAKKGTSLSGAGLVDPLSDKTKVFYMSKSGELAPIYLSETLDFQTVTGKTDATSIVFNWQAVEGVKNLYTRSGTAFGNGYIFRYKLSDDKSYNMKFVPSLSRETYTLSGLTPGSDYSIQILPVYQYVLDDKTAYSLGTGYQGTYTSNQVTLRENEVQLEKGQSTILATTVKGTTEDYPYFWGSTNPEVATVDAGGKVTALNEGTTTISVSYGGSTATCQITVTANEETSIKLNKSSLTLYVGKTATLKATVQPSGKIVTWSSSKTDVATVDKNGKVTAKKAGTCTITAAVDGVKATCSVTVKKPAIKLNKSSLSLDVKKTATLKATVDGPSKTVTWKSSNTKIATVDKNGKVTAKKAGSCTITATANGVSAKCTVKVSSEKTRAIEAYKKWLSGRSSSVKFASIYVDNNDVPELFVMLTEYGMDTVYEVFYYKGALNVNGYSFDEGYSDLVYYKKIGIYGYVDKYSASYYALSKGDRSLWSLDCYYDDIDAKKWYYHDSKNNEISKSKFNKLLKKKIGLAKPTKAKFYKNTKTNRDKYLK